MTPRPFDTVIVPDFRPGRAALFEKRALLFLACWNARAGRAREYPLHVACIGEPTERVRRAAERTGAEVTVHPPVDAETLDTSNKIRGLGIPPRTGTTFLLDADAFPLGDLAEAAGGGEGIAVAPALQPRVPERMWEEICERIGVEPPEERIDCVRAELDCPRQARGTAWDRKLPQRNIRPYYAGGAVLAPAGCGLAELWEEQIRKVRAAFDENHPHWRAIASSDQAGLTLAVQALRARGIPVRRIPDRFHAHWLHLYRGAVPAEEIRVFHAFRSFRASGGKDLPSALRRYGLFLAAGIGVEAWRQDILGGRPDRAARDLPRGLAGARLVTGRLRRAWRDFTRSA